METHDFPLSPGCQNYCHRSGSVCLGIQVVSARDWGARNSTKPCHESWPNHIGCTVHQDDNRKGWQGSWITVSDVIYAFGEFWSSLCPEIIWENLSTSWCECVCVYIPFVCRLRSPFSFCILCSCRSFCWESDPYHANPPVLEVAWRCWLSQESNTICIKLLFEDDVF